MTKSKDRSPKNPTQGYHLGLSGCEDVSAELLRFFDAIQEATMNTKKRECASLKKWRPQAQIFTTYGLRSPTPIESHTSLTHPGAHSSSSETNELEGTE